MQGSQSSIFYVGDGPSDADIARHAGLPFVAMLSGVTPKEAFANHSIYKVIEDLSVYIDSSVRWKHESVGWLELEIKGRMVDSPFSVISFFR